jgi:hypothetical protein
LEVLRAASALKDEQQQERGEQRQRQPAIVEEQLGGLTNNVDPRALKGACALGSR